MSKGMPKFKAILKIKYTRENFKSINGQKREQGQRIFAMNYSKGKAKSCGNWTTGTYIFR